ncbi:MATE family efflux transporter [Fusibacter tunisiensis]|uniref:Probable multidrug resistance protein NorM n=1 Tax=Fusibacter tunisiensis TaxID=1008308 RepID=A0ABS2MSH0_9FIRM|nr:MATE family efflux transporter [Fusibacter tunisiensis]MBM7562334.1 putative MATE family efflux protein [Fusibacter tunisiensis]
MVGSLENKKEMRISILKMIVPIMAANILEMLVGIVSMALIGDLGYIAIGAMGLSTRVRGIIWAAYKGIAIGVQVVIAQALGAHNFDRIQNAIRQTIGSIIILSIIFVLTLLLVPQYWLKLFGASGELLETGTTLLRIVGLGMPFLGTVIITSGALQGKGDATTPMIISGIMNLLNVVLGLILVRGFLFVPAYGLLGAGMAMVLSQAIAAGIAIVFMRRKGGILEGVGLTEFFKFSKPIMKAVYGTGIPSAIESLFWQLSSVLLIRAILTYGDDAYAAYQLGLQAESIAYMPAAGFQVAATAYVGRYLGAGDFENAKRYFREILMWAIVMSIIGGGILVFFPNFMLGIMTDDMSLISIGTVYLIYCGLAQVPQNMAGVIGGALRGGGYTKMPMYSAGVGLYLVRVPIALSAAYLFHFSLNVIFLAIALDMTVRLVLNSFLYFKINIYENPRLV